MARYVAYFSDAVVFHWLASMWLQLIATTFVFEPIYIVLNETVSGLPAAASAAAGRARAFGVSPTSDDSFSAVSTATIASKEAFFSIFRDLQDLHSFAPLKSQILQIFRKFFAKFRILSDFAKCC